MPNSSSLAQQISLFRSRIQNRRFDDVTVRILESILVSKDVQSLTGVESALKQFMRDESILILGEITQESVEIKLLCSDFLIRVLALIGDVEACEKALMCSEANHVSHAKMDDFFHDVHAIKKIKILKDVALLAISPQSVKAQAQAYMKQKEVEQSTQHLATSLDTQSSGSSRFRNGTIKHNLRKLHAYRCT